MVNFSEVYTYSDQPVSCPKCGSRTIFTLDLSHTSEKTQIHKCLNNTCQFEFVIEIDEDPDGEE